MSKQVNLVSLCVLLLFLVFMLSGCSTVRPAFNSAIDSLRDVSTIGGEIDLGPVSIGGGYDGNGGVNFSFGFDLFKCLCEWEWLGLDCSETPEPPESTE